MSLRREDGSALVEFTLLVPVLVLLLLFVVLAGRVMATRADVQGAAADAARAASLRAAPGQATADAVRVAEATLTGRGVRCSSLAVEIGTGALRPGGEVTAAVACRVELGDLGLLGVPGSVTVSARSTEVVDRFVGS